jgi:hypothetical protein
VFLSLADLEARVDQLKASETDLKNIVYREKDVREVLEYEYKKLSHECVMHMELREASDRDLVNCYKSLQKLNEDCDPTVLAIFPELVIVDGGEEVCDDAVG